VISPLRYIDTTPSTLRADFKDQYRVLIASAYKADHNIGRAKARIALLGDADPIQALTAQAQRMLGAGESFNIIQDVAGLATDLNSGVASVPPAASPNPTSYLAAIPPTQFVPGSNTGTPVEIVESPTLEPTSQTVVFDTPTPRPTRTPIPTAGAPVILASQDAVCNPNLTEGLMQISVLDSHHHQMAGMEIIINWPGGEEHFFTGFKPEIANGYADYIMQPGVIYTVRVGKPGIPVPNLSSPACPDTSGQTFTGGLKLVFQQP
jgi:hypothetical protein